MATSLRDLLGVGISGYSGKSGYSGIGSSGYSGKSGYSGYSGDNPGSSGYSGQSGYSGRSGYSGVGLSGYSGISGYSGVGTSGYSGATGAGTSGTSGISGYSGFSGDNPGSSGYSGISGYSGVGLSGYSGLGTSGYSGFSGYSGYSDSTAANVLYVSKSGNDSNSGTSLSAAKLTIKSAVTAANALQAANPTGTTVILLKAGDYTEDNPVSMSAGVSIVGDNLRAVTVRPLNTTSDIFWVKNRCYITGITFRDHLSPAAAVAFPSTGAGAIVTSPYIQNCSSITTTGCGMRVDGSLASGLKSMVLDSYTQFNQGGLGIHITNEGYAQLVSIFTICCLAGVKCENGGTCSITNSNNSFGDYGLWADGVGSVLYTGKVVTGSRNSVTIEGLSTRPAVNDALLVESQSQYLLVRSATALSGPGANTSTITFDEILEFSFTPGANVDFKQISLISASGQTFEYVGTGTSILTATPRLGGIPNTANEIHETNGGRVNYTSTDQFGDFRIGDGLVIREEAGVIEGVTFDRSLFAVLTPYILALEG